MSVKVDCLDTGLYGQGFDINRSLTYNMYDGKAIGLTESTFDQDFNIKEYIKSPLPVCTFSDCNIYERGSKLHDGSLFMTKLTEGPDETYTWAVNTANHYYAKGFTFGCTITGSPEDEPVIAHSISFLAQVDANCTNTTNYRHKEMPELIFSIYKSNSKVAGGPQVENQFWYIMDLSIGYIIRPSICQLYDCRVISETRTELYAVIDGQKSPDLWYMSVDTKRYQNREDYQLVCDTDKEKE